MRVLFVSHTLPLPGQPVSNIGGMQRMAAVTTLPLDDPEQRLAMAIALAITP